MGDNKTGAYAPVCVVPPFWGWLHCRWFANAMPRVPTRALFQFLQYLLHLCLKSLNLLVLLIFLALQGVDYLLLLFDGLD